MICQRQRSFPLIQNKAPCSLTFSNPQTPPLSSLGPLTSSNNTTKWAINASRGTIGLHRREVIAVCESYPASHSTRNQEVSGGCSVRELQHKRPLRPCASSSPSYSNCVGCHPTLAVHTGHWPSFQTQGGRKNGEP